MNWDHIQGNWKQMKGKVKEKWGKLTDDEFDQVAGHRDQLVGKIQERYGLQKDEAESQVKDWESGCIWRSSHGERAAATGEVAVRPDAAGRPRAGADSGEGRS